MRDSIKCLSGIEGVIEGLQYMAGIERMVGIPEDAERMEEMANRVEAMADDNKALRSRLEYAAETFDMLEEHTHANIECDAAAAACRELL